MRDKYIVNALTDENDKVFSYSITTCSDDFQPLINNLPLSEKNEVTLGSTTFEEFYPKPLYIEYRLGAHDWTMVEGVYEGNPSRYQSVFWGGTELCWGDRNIYDGFIMLPFSNTEITPDVQSFRENTTFNTIMITDSYVFLEDVIKILEVLRFGPNGYDIQIIPELNKNLPFF